MDDQRESAATVAATATSEDIEAAEDRVVSSARTSFGIGFIVVAVVVVFQLVLRLSDTVGLIVSAIVIALVTDPVRAALSRRIGRPAGFAVTALGTYGVITATAAVVWQGLEKESTRLADVLTERIDALSPGSLPDRVADVTDASRTVTAIFDRLPLAFITGSDSAVGAGRHLVELLVAVILAAFLQGSASSILDWTAARWDRPSRAEVRDFIGDVVGRGASFARRSLTLGWCTAVVVGGVSAALSTSGAVMLGAWAGVWVIVPRIGAVVGLLPFVIAGFSTSWPIGVVTLIAAVAVAASSRLVRRRWVAARLRVPATAWVVAYGLGSSIAGPGGAAVALTVMALIVAAITSDLTLPARRVDTTPALATRWTSTLGRFDLSTLAGIGLGTCGVALAWLGIAELVPVFVWVVVAGMVAIAIDRPVGWFERRARLSRGAATVVVLLVAAVFVAGVVLLGVRGAASSTEQASQGIPEVVSQLESAPVVGEWLQDRDAAVWVDSQLQDLPQRLSEARGVSTWLPEVGDRTIDLMWTLLLAIVLSFEGPRLASALAAQAPARRRRQFVRLGTVSLDAIAGYLAGAILVASINATVVFTIAALLGLGLAPVLAAWAFIWNFVPQIGGFMGGFPLVVLALGAGPLAALIAATVYLAYQLIENHLIQPKVIGNAIDVPAWATLLTALAGGAAAGLVGAVVLTPLVGVVHLALREYRSADFPGRTTGTTDAAVVEAEAAASADQDPTATGLAPVPA